MKIIKKISKYNYTRYSSRSIKYIVIHYVGAVSTAKNNAAYFAGGNKNASSHYFVDDTTVYQSVEDKNAAWHCGGRLQGGGGHVFYKKCLNANSIGVELCCKKKSGKLYITDETIKQAAELVRDLMKKYGVPASRVIRHYDVTGKSCPAPYLNEKKWADLKKTLVGTTTSKKPTKPAAPTATIRRYSRGEQVKRLQRCLNYLIAAGLAIDGSFGPLTLKATKKFQKKYKLAVDGSCGPKTRAKIRALLK